MAELDRRLQELEAVLSWADENPDGGVIEEGGKRIEYSDREGNRTSFDFSGYHRRSASADTFRFDPPAGVQIIRAD